MPDRAPVYRAPLRSRRDDVDHERAVEWALDQGVVGVGGVLGSEPADLDDAIARVEDEHTERVARRLERFAQVPEGAFVWTRHPQEGCYVGRVEGPWRYDARATAVDLDLAHVRDCRWSPEPVAESDVPAGVLATFARGGRNFQQTHDDDAERLTPDVWSAAAGGTRSD